ncbi:MAG: chemotaxis protein CheB [Nodosilinea sp.]
MSTPPSAPPPEPPANVNQTLPAGPEDVFPVVGIGASAGGLEAFTQLLSHLPNDTGMAFVLVQHLDPRQDSLLSEIISRTTTMSVRQVTDGLAVAPNQVYVIPPNTIMTLQAGTLRLNPRQQAQRVNKTIDAFFEALARDRGNKAIGVVLSGGDSDGTLGVEAIKAAGGITFAQSEASAQVISMPHMAIASGQVDFILTPAEIAQNLASISHHPYVTSPLAVPLPLETDASEDALARIFRLLRATTRIDFSQYKPTTLMRRIFHRMALHQLEELDGYSQYLQDNSAEVQALSQEILISVTGFFRDTGAFDTLKQEVFPALLRDCPANAPLRIWVAGCSTGEEAYSIAIVLLEFLTYQPRQPAIQIFATDVSEQAIEIARLGFYPPAKVAGVSPDRLQRFFVPVEGGYQISKLVRELCIFARQNLISDPPFSRLDLISCRNVLIYFSSTLQKKALPMFHYGLNPRGFLMLGSSETVGEFSDLFILLNRQYKIYAKQSSSLRLNLDFGEGSYLGEAATFQPLAGGQSPSELDLYGAADQVILSRYSPAGVVVNGNLDIVQFRGQTGIYLEPAPGRASLNLLSMAKAELQLDLRTAIYQAQQSGQTVRKDGLVVQDGEIRRSIDIEVLPFQPSAATETYFVVLFAAAPVAAAVVNPLVADPTALPRSSISVDRQDSERLQHELAATRSHLQSIIEKQEATNQDLRAANEEILSSNEELQSTNEELQTAKEEIQATNEELNTINDELYRRNAETTRISNDFQNLLSSINIPILMLEGDLSIRRFTPTATAIFNLIPTDMGRPFGDINHRLTLPDLEQRILDVITTLNQHSQEVQDQDGHWYDLRIRPYRTLDNRIDGAVLVLVDIDDLKRSADELRQARDYAEAIVELVQESLLILDANLSVVRANQRFYEIFQVTPAETEGSPIFKLSNGQWNIPALRSLLEDILPHNTPVENYQVTHEFQHIGAKTMRLNARIIPSGNGTPLILLAIEDIS